MNTELTTSLEQNKNTLMSMVSSSDLKSHDLQFGRGEKLSAAALFIDGLINQSFMSAALLRPLAALTLDSFPDGMAYFGQSVFLSGEISIALTVDECLTGLFEGCIVFLCEGMSEALIISAKGWDKRGITDPQTQSVIRGPREAFTENLRTNTALIRRRLKTPTLRIEERSIGRRSSTRVSLIYLEDVVSRSVLDDLKARLDRVDVDSILDSGNLEQYIDNSPLSIFPRTGFTEKPDVAAANILEGRIGIVVEGSPFVLTVPMLFIESFQSSEDYYSSTVYASIARILRFVTFAIATLGPAAYISLTTYHQEFIPTTLLFTLAKANENIPFPAFIEAAIMVFAFEILKEAGLRLPRPVGQAMSIVGALIMGEAAVGAGIVGEPMVITVALTAVCGFTVSWLNDAVFILRIITMIAAAVLGGYGITLVVLATMIYLASLESYGVKYLSGLTPSDGESLKDYFVRAPLWSMRRRPKWIAGRNTVRRGRRPE